MIGLLRVERESLIDILSRYVALLWKDWPREMECKKAHWAPGNQSYILTGECPYRRHDATFHQITDAYRESLEEDEFQFCAVFKCPTCDKFILGILRESRTYEPSESGSGMNQVFHATYETHYPLGSPDDSFEEGIPLSIGNCLSEALRCMGVNAFNAAAEMCRRAIEGSCILLGAPRSKNKLMDKIDWLVQQQEITPFLGQVAHKIRLGGDRGAHFPDSESTASADEEIIGKEQAQAIIKFTREYLHHVYVVRRELGEYDFSKSGAAQAKKDQKGLPPAP